jgi:hypothetical protein
MVLAVHFLGPEDELNQREVVKRADFFAGPIVTY